MMNNYERGIAYITKGETGTKNLDKNVKYEYEYKMYNLYVNGVYIAGAYTHFWTKNKDEKIRKGTKQFGSKFKNTFEVVSIDKDEKIVKLRATVTHFSAFIKYDESEEFIVEVNDNQLERMEKAMNEGQDVKLTLQKIWRKTSNILTLTHKITR